MSAVRILPRAALLVVALGIVAMHHLAGVGHCSGLPAGHAMVMGAPAPPVGAVVEPAASYHDGASGHLCLAVVTAAGALLALVALGVLGVLPVPGRTGPRTPTRRRSRAPPPVRRRLAELQVLRT